MWTSYGEIRHRCYINFLRNVSTVYFTLRSTVHISAIHNSHFYESRCPSISICPRIVIGESTWDRSTSFRPREDALSWLPREFNALNAVAIVRRMTENYLPSTRWWWTDGERPESRFPFCHSLFIRLFPSPFSPPLLLSFSLSLFLSTYLSVVNLQLSYLAYRVPSIIAPEGKKKDFEWKRMTRDSIRDGTGIALCWSKNRRR